MVDEWVVLYRWQLSLRGSDVSDVHIWRVETPSLRVKYERQIRSGGLELPSWVDVDALPAINPVQDVCTRGFRAPDDGSGLSFASGVINLSGVADRRDHQFLLCRVLVGRAFALLDPAAPRRVPEGYDSLYIHHEENDDPSAHYRHEYVVLDPAQSLPEYVVHFTFDPTAVITEPPATVDMALDARREHFRSKVDEVRSEVSRALAVLGPSLGARTEEMLSELTTRYEGALQQSTRPEALLEERKRSAHEGIRRITSKLEEVKANSDAVYTAVCKRLQDALEKLEDLTRRKTAILLSEELELRRQLQLIEHVESFVPVIQDRLAPTAFVEAWENHLSIRRDILAQMAGASATMIGDALDRVRPDLKVVGEIDIVEATAPAALAAASMAVSASAAAAAAASASFAGVSIPPAPQQQQSHQPLQAQAALRSSAIIPAPGASAGSASLSQTWASFIRQDLGLPEDSAPSMATHPTAAAPAASSAHPMASPASSTLDSDAAAFIASVISESSGAISVEQAQARLDIEEASLAQVRSRAAALPPAQRALGDAAVAQQGERVEAARAALAAATRRPAPAARAAAPVTSAAPVASAGRGGGGPSYSATAAAAPSRPAATVSTRPAPAVAAPVPTDASAAGVAAGGSGLSPPREAAVRVSAERLVERHRLSAEAERRKRRVGIDDESIDSLAFPGSALLQGADARNVYLLLPFVPPAMDVDPATGQAPGPVPPLCELMFSTRLNSPASYFKLLEAVSNREGPTVVIVRANGHTFGGYSADSWRADGLWYGRTVSFLFSVTRDCRIPFVGRINGPPQPNDADLRAKHEQEHQERLERWQMAMMEQRADAEANGVVFGETGDVIANPDGYDLTPLSYPPPRFRPFKRVDAQRCDDAHLRFGLTDLVISATFAGCTSELESSYGIGLKPGSVEAKTFLAGAHEFNVDEIEVWHVGEPAFDGVVAGSEDMDAGGGYAPPAAGYAHDSGYGGAAGGLPVDSVGADMSL